VLAGSGENTDLEAALQYAAVCPHDMVTKKFSEAVLTAGMHRDGVSLDMDVKDVIDTRRIAAPGSRNALPVAAGSPAKPRATPSHSHRPSNPAPALSLKCPVSALCTPVSDAALLDPCTR
jgi:hypothetical protein